MAPKTLLICSERLLRGFMSFLRGSQRFEEAPKRLLIGSERLLRDAKRLLRGFLIGSDRL